MQFINCKILVKKPFLLVSCICLVFFCVPWPGLIIKSDEKCIFLDSILFMNSLKC